MFIVAGVLWITLSRPGSACPRTGPCPPPREGTPGTLSPAGWPACHVTARWPARARRAGRARRHVRCAHPPSAPSATRSDTSPSPAGRESEPPACAGFAERCPRCWRRCTDLNKTTGSKSAFKTYGHVATREMTANVQDFESEIA